MQIVRLVAGELRAEIAPEIGGSITAFWTEAGRHHRTHWLRPASEAALEIRDPLGMASFPLVPFCNRIRDGRASFEGREIRFPPNHPSQRSPHPLHGLGWQREWVVDNQNRHAVDLSLQMEATDAWPWRFLAQQRIELDELSLRVSVSVTNQDSVDMPAGLGHHPYFLHPPGTRLTCPTAGMWTTDAEVMPVDLSRDGIVERLRQGVIVGDLDLDNNFVGWEHSARIDWPAAGDDRVRSLIIRAEAPLDYFVIYCPPGLDHFCAEPVSQCTDWLNLLPRHDAALLGGARVGPGDRYTASFSLLPSLT